MKRRKSRVPSFDSLEGRVVMSRAPVVGALGDSYTDEYRFYPPDRSQARNWVEILAAHERVRFGPFSLRARPEPRDGGFALNWARSDAESPEVIAEQLPGLTRQVATGRVDYAWLFFGGNDYLHYIQRHAEQGHLPTPEQLGADIRRITTTASANFDQAATTLLAASPRVRLVVATVPDLRSLPIFRPYQDIPGAEAATAVIQQGLGAYNQHIREVAASNPRRIALVDLDRLLQPVAESGATELPFDGTTIDLVNPGDGYRNFYLADGLHVGTVGQGLIADAFVGAIREQFGARVAPLAPSQIVHYARAIAAHARPPLRFTR